MALRVVFAEDNYLMREGTAALFAETSTLGVRRHAFERDVLDRRWDEVATPYGAVRVKVALRDGREVGATRGLLRVRLLDEQHRKVDRRLTGERAEPRRLVLDGMGGDRDHAGRRAGQAT